ncbi:MAG: hypothetical protein H7A23_25595 [Leptospiraceae bacterium]|nr:hypothetical protein [Leptospiraceae bacterium]MCP5497942.1 hypothetical protein [Leptospiraceae bacterium]
MSTRIIQENRPAIQRWEHTDFGSEIPYFDDELEMSQSIEHEITINYLSYSFKFIGKNLGLTCISDHPVWYLLIKPEKGKTQKVIYPDLCMSKESDVSRITSEDLLFCLEVVSTERKEKEIKDSQLMKKLNEYNRVPEFVLIYPKLDDNRTIEYFIYDGNQYIPLEKQNGLYHSRAIKGLSIRELPGDDWRDGEKIDVLYNGKVLVKYDELWDMVDEEKQRAEQAENQLKSSIKKAIQRGKLTIEEIAEDFEVSVGYVREVTDYIL